MVIVSVVVIDVLAVWFVNLVALMLLLLLVFGQRSGPHHKRLARAGPKEKEEPFVDPGKLKVNLRSCVLWCFFK